MSEKNPASRRPRGRPKSEEPTADRHVMVRLTAELHEAAPRLAEADDRPLGSWIRQIVAQRVEAQREPL